MGRVDIYPSALLIQPDPWTDYTPTLTQSVVVTKTVTFARYTRVGRTIQVSVLLDVTGTGTANNPVIVGLPVTPIASPASVDILCGTMDIFDTSSSNYYLGAAFFGTTTGTVTGRPNAAANKLGETGGTFAAALVSGDKVFISVTYEAAS